MWLRYAKSLSDTELVCICEPEVGETLSDEEERSVSGLINCQEGRDEFSNCQVGNEMRSLEDLIDCWEDSSGNSYCQEGNGMCYPRYLGITRRSCLEAHMVLDMDYRERD